MISFRSIRVYESICVRCASWYHSTVVSAIRCPFCAFPPSSFCPTSHPPPSTNINLFLRLQYLLLNHLLQVLRLLCARPPPQDLAIPPNQKLFEIPLHPLQPQQPRLLVLEPLPRRVCLVAVNLGKALAIRWIVIVAIVEKPRSFCLSKLVPAQPQPQPQPHVTAKP